MPKVTVAVEKEYKIIFTARPQQQDLFYHALRLFLHTWKMSQGMMRLEVSIHKTLESFFKEHGNPEKINFVK